MVERSKSILHVVVGDSPWRTGNIKYRRHHLAEYLSFQQTTEAVYWPYPHWGTRRAFTAATGSASELEASAGRLPRPIREFPVPTRRTSGLYARLLHQAVLSEFTEQIRSNSAPQKVLWFTLPIFASLLEPLPWTKIVYDCSDHWTGLQRPGSWKSKVVSFLRSRSEARIVHRSSILFASSRYIADSLSNTFARDSILVENGVDVHSFRVAERQSDLEGQLPPRPRLGFFGALKEQRIDFDLLYAVALAAPNFNLVLVGPASDPGPALGRLLRLPNVTWLGARRPQDVPRIMKLMDLGLIPYRGISFNAGAFPLKFLEYLAAGLPVVGCGAPSIDRYARKGVYISTDGTPERFLTACRTALTWASGLSRRLAIAQENDWRAKLARMHDVVITDLTPE